MKISVQILADNRFRKVSTVVESNGKIYADGTTIMPTTEKCESLDLETLESVKNHIIRIQQDLLRDTDGKTKCKRL